MSKNKASNKNNIDWNQSQLVIKYGHSEKYNNDFEDIVILTSGKHTDDTFEGMVVGPPLTGPDMGCIKNDWTKSMFNKYLERITLKVHL